eukprot:gnl/MRDRNA2_/MRDRNA2_88993_c0_seq1.p1 gnl/MRDRNA2_/MRDRNA2_88993_c0~~gnl/MRDRNA2_/MRDRNA2_88993_c0_seq1.p1  ORF type:complete len:399 (-),score=123.22 gnl/MRDRNA2_/MRDRNA2_88993_c0_seq1:260-1456(-)
MAKEVMLSDGPSGGGGGGDFSAPPPPGGLGNFKGVMLCNRPTEISMDKAGSGGDGPPPFKSTVSATHNDQLGLNPNRPPPSTDSEAKLRGPSAALRKHVKWLKQLQKEMSEERSKTDEEQMQAEMKKERMKKFCEKQREAVKTLLNSEHEVTKEHLEGAIEHAGVGKKTKDGKRCKPLWAMTEQEKESVQEKEADDLLSFADNLDFDQYIGDYEFRQNLEVLKDRAGKLSKEQDAFKEAIVNEFNEDEDTTAAGSPRELDGGFDGLEGSSLGVPEGPDGVRRPKRNKQSDDGLPDWDSSTCVGDEAKVAHEEDREIAARVLEQHPGVRGIHSEKSVQKILEKQREKERAKELVDLVEQLKKDASAPDPVIVTSSDTKGKANKKVDPSMLPYLYRSPAI